MKGGFRTFSAPASRALPDHESGHSARIVLLTPGSPTGRAGSRLSLLPRRMAAVRKVTLGICKAGGELLLHERWKKQTCVCSHQSSSNGRDVDSPSLRGTQDQCPCHRPAGSLTENTVDISTR